MFGFLAPGFLLQREKKLNWYYVINKEKIRKNVNKKAVK